MITLVRMPIMQWSSVESYNAFKTYALTSQLVLASSQTEPDAHMRRNSRDVLCLVQACTALAQKISALRSELKGRPRMAVRRLDVTL